MGVVACVLPDSGSLSADFVPSPPDQVSGTGETVGGSSEDTGVEGREGPPSVTTH